MYGHEAGYSVLRLCRDLLSEVAEVHLGHENFCHVVPADA